MLLLNESTTPTIPQNGLKMAPVMATTKRTTTIWLQLVTATFIFVSFVISCACANDIQSMTHDSKPSTEYNVRTVQEVVVEDEACGCENSNTAASSESSAFHSLGLSGNVSECCCSYRDMEQTNLDIVHPLLSSIVATPFFSHFKVNLCSECRLWEDSPQCMLRDCGVCESDDPPVWAVKVDKSITPGDCENGFRDDLRKLTFNDDGDHFEDWVVRTVDSRVNLGWPSLLPPHEDRHFNASLPTSTKPNSQYLKDNDDGGSAVVVDLKLNPERYTGYSGESADKVWSAIHSTNCFQPPSSQPHRSSHQFQPSLNPEFMPAVNEEEELPTSTRTSLGSSDEYCELSDDQRVYNRLISGMHSSISLHIAHSYCLSFDPHRVGECLEWGPNAALAHERVLHHPDRLSNLYVAFGMLLRAVVKAGGAVAAAVPIEPPPNGEMNLYHDSALEWTESLLPQLTKLESTCPQTFDESLFFSSREERLELQSKFQQLQEIMRCVGCDRCKLWGMLQTLGIGTALRVLFHGMDDETTDEPLELSRQEAVALVNTLERFSSALVFAQSLHSKQTGVDESEMSLKSGQSFSSSHSSLLIDSFFV